jgi:hypothetical protein
MDNAPPTTHRISEFHKWNKEGRLDLKPPYQRKPVWTLKNKSFLMDTILSGLPVPEIYMQVITSPKGDTRYEIVDGQQRLRAILEFIDGKYSILDDEETPDYRGKEFAELSDGDKGNFWSYPLVVRELKTNKEIEVRGIFKRLNKNVVPLTAQELRHSTYTGLFIKLVEDLADKEFWTENKIVTPAHIRRMRDVEFVSELLVGIMNGAQDGTKILDSYYSLYDLDFKERDKFEKNFRKIQQFVEVLMGDLRGTSWNNKGDFYGLFLATGEILNEYNIPVDKKNEIRRKLTDYRRRVGNERETSDDPIIREYTLTITYDSSGKENRVRRINIVKRLILAYVIPKYPRRGFSEEQKQMIWDLSKDKKYAICKKIVEFNEYYVDYKIPYADGGLTIVNNGQIIHKSHRKP